MVEREKEIKQSYEAYLAALNSEDPEPLTPKPLRLVSSPLVLKSQQELPIRLSSSHPPISGRSSPAASSFSESENLGQPRQSGGVKKTSRKNESQLRREAEEREKNRRNPKFSSRDFKTHHNFRIS